MTVKWLCLREQLNTIFFLAMSFSFRLVSMILGFIHIVLHTNRRFSPGDGSN